MNDKKRSRAPIIRNGVIFTTIRIRRIYHNSSAINDNNKMHNASSNDNHRFWF